MYVSESRVTRLGRARRLGLKRAFDVVFSTVTLVLLSPLMLAIALAVRLTSKGPALFRHRRVGLGGKEFLLCKFRTMVTGAEQMRQAFTPEQQAEFQKSYKLRDDPRVTKLGRFLRRTSLDELPQFFNVLNGEMSVVGPRPVTHEELEKYGAASDTLLTVNPGITGLWQVSGRSNTTYDERVDMDMRYVNQGTLAMDLRIILATVRAVLGRLGAY